jgi:hypothetical protein
MRGGGFGQSGVEKMYTLVFIVSVNRLILWCALMPWKRPFQTYTFLRRRGCVAIF